MKNIRNFFENDQSKTFQDNLLEVMNERKKIEKQIFHTQQEYKDYIVTNISDFLLNKINPKDAKLREYLSRGFLKTRIADQLEWDLNVIRIKKEGIVAIMIEEIGEESIVTMDDFVNALNRAWDGFVVLKSIDAFQFSWEFVV